MSKSQQLLSLKKIYPDLIYLLKPDYLKFTLILQPTPKSKKYKVEFIFANDVCDVWLTGEIEGIKNVDFPHYYEMKKDRVKLCLLHPKKFEWSTIDWLEDSIIPWTIEWLLYYELWLITGKWYGGGEHPEEENIIK